MFKKITVVCILCCIAGLSYAESFNLLDGRPLWIKVHKRNHWIVVLSTLDGLTVIDLKVTEAGTVTFLVKEPCMNPFRIRTLGWGAGSSWALGMNCDRDVFYSKLPPLWEHAVGIPPEELLNILAQGEHHAK